jgi:hypothetical protein
VGRGTCWAMVSCASPVPGGMTTITSLAGAIIVSTPQDLALIDATKHVGAPPAVRAQEIAHVLDNAVPSPDHTPRDRKGEVGVLGAIWGKASLKQARIAKNLDCCRTVADMVSRFATQPLFMCESPDLKSPRQKTEGFFLFQNAGPPAHPRQDKRGGLAGSDCQRRYSGKGDVFGHCGWKYLRLCS